MLTDAQLAKLVTLAKTNFPDGAKTPAAERERWIFFVVRRGAFHMGNEGWSVTDPQLEQAIKDELKAAHDFLKDELGTGADSLGKRTPAHLDLVDVFKTHTGDKAAAVKPKVTQAVQDRKDRVAKITIRALAAHFNLWDTGSGGKPTVKRAPAREIIDRRLRMVERMLLNVNGGAGENLTWTVSAPSSWTDTFRVRIFEYPYIKASDGGQALLKAAAARNIPLPLHVGSREAVYQQTATNKWDWLKVLFSDGALRELLWDEPPPFPETSSAKDPPPIGADGRAITNARLPTMRLRWAFKVSPKKDDSHALRFFPQPAQAPAGQALTLSQAIDSLVGDPATPKTDYWDRAWMYCDHVISALHIEALLFARRRRVGTAAADAEIDALGAFQPPGQLVHPDAYVWLGAIPNEAINQPNQSHGGLLDGRPDNDHFVTLLKDPDSFTLDNDLEIGDQVVFFNSAIYDLLTAGALRLENATLTDVGADEKTGKLDLGKLKFAGHGMVGNLADYAQEFIDTINTELGEVRSTIKKAAAAATLVTLSTGHHAIRWAPYPLPQAAVATIRPWWLVYPLKELEDTTFSPVATSIDDAVRSLPGTFGFPSGAGTQTVVTATRAAGGLPTKQTIATAPPFTLFDPTPLNLTQDELVLFPIAEPTSIKASAGDLMPAWGRYLARRAQGPVTTTLAPLVADSSHIPGLFDADGKVLSTGPKVRP